LAVGTFDRSRDASGVTGVEELRPRTPFWADLVGMTAAGSEPASSHLNRIYRGQIPKEAILRANGSKRGKLLFRRAIIEKHYRIGGTK
jgi:hypothetical protein